MTVHFTGPVVQDGRHAGRGQYTNAPVHVDLATHVKFDDFDGVALDTTNDWTVVKDSGASVALAADTQFGECLITSAATTDADGGSIQGNEVFKLITDYETWFWGRMKLSDATQSAMAIGFSVNFATNPEAMLAAADHVMFTKADGTDVVVCSTEKDGTGTTTTTTYSMADATYTQFGIHCIGTSSVEFYLDGSLVATHTTNINDDEEMTIGAYALSGDTTGTHTASIDYIGAAQQR